MLVRLGFHVIEAVDGEEGVALLREHRDEVDVVLLDLMMPRLSGEEAFERMLALKPNLKVLVMSGYSELEVEGRFRGGKHSGFIQKPFTFADLEEGVRAAVAAG
jgi:CheY-like chemotaxis protein